MGLKENFYQALRELLGGARTDSKQNKETADDNRDKQYASFNRDISDTYEDVFAEFKAKPVEFNSSDTFIKSNPVSRPVFDDFTAGQPPRTGRTAPYSAPVETPPAFFSSPNDPGQPVPERPEREMSVISRNTIVYGDIRTLADLTIDGKVRGNIDVLKDITMHGMLVGNLRCGNARMEGSSIQGNVMSKGNAYIHNDSVLLGNLKAQNSNIDGKVKGNLNIGNRAYLHQNAIVVGDINTNTIAVEDGANIKGFVNTAFLFEKESAPFPNEVVIEGSEVNLDDSDN